MIIYFDSDFNLVEEEQATIAKVIPDNGEAPYFITMNGEEDKDDRTASV